MPLFSTLMKSSINFIRLIIIIIILNINQRKKRRRKSFEINSSSINEADSEECFRESSSIKNNIETINNKSGMETKLLRFFRPYHHGHGHQERLISLSSFLYWIMLVSAIISYPSNYYHHPTDSLPSSSSSFLQLFPFATAIIIEDDHNDTMIMVNNFSLSSTPAPSTELDTLNETFLVRPTTKMMSLVMQMMMTMDDGHVSNENHVKRNLKSKLQSQLHFDPGTTNKINVDDDDDLYNEDSDGTSEDYDEDVVNHIDDNDDEEDEDEVDDVDETMKKPTRNSMMNNRHRRHNDDDDILGDVVNKDDAYDHVQQNDFNKKHSQFSTSLIQSLTTTTTTTMKEPSSINKRIPLAQNDENFTNQMNKKNSTKQERSKSDSQIDFFVGNLNENYDDMKQSSFDDQHTEQQTKMDDKQMTTDASSTSMAQGPRKNLIQLIMSRIKIPCRTEWGIELPFDVYMLDTCARCYHHMPYTAFKPEAKFSYRQYGTLYHPIINLTLTSDETLELSQTFISMSMVFKWQQCCTDAIFCCINYYQKYHEHRVNQTTMTGTNSSMLDHHRMHENECPPTWDGWLCWDEYAKPNQLLERPCPKHIYWHQRVPPCRGYVTKLCNSSGHWYVNNDNREWSNYTMCARDDIYARRIRYSLVTNIISMFALIPALLIFSHYKQVSSMSRIRLHKHLFTSLLFHALTSALLKWHLLDGFQPEHLFKCLLPIDWSEWLISSTKQMPSFCMILSILLRYFRSTNYLWMFNEALYLHQLIKHAFTQPSLRPLIILAYSLSFITTTSYIATRALYVPTSNSPETTLANSATTTTTMPNILTINNTHQQSNITNIKATTIKAPMLNPEPSLVELIRINNKTNYFDDYPAKNIQDALMSMIMSTATLRQEVRDIILSTDIDNDQDNHRTRSPAELIIVERLVSGDDHLNNIESSTPQQTDYMPYQTTNGHDHSVGDLDNHDIPINIDSFEEDQALMDDDQCWLMPSQQPWHEWIINGPNLAILIINCFFLVWLLRVLCIKAAASSTMMAGTSSSPPPLPASSRNHSRQSRNHRENTSTSSANNHNSNHSLRLKSSKTNGCSVSFSTSPTSTSTLFHHHRHHRQPTLFNRQSFLVSLRAAVLLLPLYGLHYLFIVYRPKIENCWLSETYHYLSLSLDGLQGLMVSIIFCFANSEIRNLLTRSFQRVSNRQRSLTIYMTEVGPIANRD